MTVKIKEVTTEERKKERTKAGCWFLFLLFVYLVLKSKSIFCIFHEFCNTSYCLFCAYLNKEK
jgi:hypothetical protein